MDILDRIRANARRKAGPLRIVSSGEDWWGLSRLRFFRSWWVEFDREPQISEVDAMQQWATDNCAGAFFISGIRARLYNEVDWNLFITVYK